MGITQAHIKQGNICYIPGGKQPSAVGIQSREKSCFTCSLPLGFWRSSCLYFLWGRNPDAITGQGCGGKTCYTCPPPLFSLTSGICLFFFPHLNRQSNSTSYSLNHLTFLLGKRKRRKKDLKDWESLILGMELKQVGQKPLEPARCCLLAVWFQFEEVPLQGARCFPLKLCFLPRHFVKATPQAALVDLLNVSKHLLSLLWCQEGR